MMTSVIIKKNEIEKPKGVEGWVSTLFMITIFLSSLTLFKSPFEFYIHYIIYLGLLPFLFIRFKPDKYLIGILGISFLIGLFCLVRFEFSPFNFIKVWGGLSLTLSFYSYMLKYFKYDIKYLFHLYMIWSKYMALIGFVQFVSYRIGFKFGYDYGWILNKWSVNPGGVLGLRINGIFSEPSTLAVVLAPAVYVAFYNILNKRKTFISTFWSLMLLFVYLGSASSTAYIGLLIIFLLVVDGVKLRYMIFGIAGISIIFITMYRNVDEFRSRVDSSVGLWYYQDFRIENTNTSSFVLYNSFNVATSSFIEYPLFGTGLGSFENAYEKHTLTNSVIKYDFEFNKSDGNSMFLRLMVETGLLGLVFIGVLLFRGFVKKDEVLENLPFRIISQSILIMFLLYLLRQGNYFLNGLPCFYLFYYFNGRNYKLFQKERTEKNESPNPLL